MCGVAAAQEGRFPAVSEAVRQPNVWLIVLDDMDPDHWTAPHAVHPNLDRLRTEGVFYPNGYTGQVCRPGHASILTGKTPRNHGRLNNQTPGTLDPADTLGVVLRDAGYATMLGGKLWEGEPAEFGFDETDGYAEPGSGEPQATFVRDGQAGFLDFVATAIEPWFAYYAPALPHLPANAPAAFYVDPATIPVPEHVPAEAIDTYRNREAAYLSNLAWVDAAIGEGLAALEQSGRLDNTWVIVTADNGWSWAYVSKQSPFEHGIRSPLCLWRLGLRAPGERPDLVSTVDILPTVCGLAGADVPAGVDGRDILTGSPRRMLVGENWSKRAYPGDDDNSHIATWVRYGRWKYIRWQRAIDSRHPNLSWQSEYDLIQRPAGDEDLYDLETDATEQTDLAGSPEYNGLLRRLRREAALAMERK